MRDLSTEIKFKTARSGGKGGQNVNKVETMVEGYWKVAKSNFLTEEEKERVISKLSNKINSRGELVYKSQATRSQLENKMDVIEKIQAAISTSLEKEKVRKKTRPSKASKAKRLESKIRASEIKVGRRKISL